MRIRWDRLKTITSVRLDVLSAGSKPLVPPYRVLVFSPIPAPPFMLSHHVYEFVSFDEFRLDVRRFLLDAEHGKQR